MWVPDWLDADGIEINIPDLDQPMRPVIHCPHCHRRGAVQRRIGTKPFVVHHCPGPFVLDHVEEAESWTAGFRLALFATPHVGIGGDVE
jgi:hypothetical protein